MIRVVQTATKEMTVGTLQYTILYSGQLSFEPSARTTLIKTKIGEKGDWLIHFVFFVFLEKVPHSL